MIRVLVVSPSSGTRRALEQAVAQDPGLVLVTTSDALASPDVIVLDPGPEGQLPLPVLLEQRPSRDAVPVVVLLEDLESEAGARVLRAGARAILPRDASPEEIRAAVHATAAGLASLPAALARALLEDKAGDGAGAPVGAGDGALTPREREILTLLGEGLVNKQIGVRLGISEHTVKTHLAAIYEKLEAANRAEAVATGLRRGLIML
jgi:NarL family two-component system response regulator YdfI